MSDKVSDEFLRHWRGRIIGELHASVYDELLQRRRDGGSPEEFVVQMAAKAAEIKPQHRAHFLHCLGEIHRAVDCVRQYLAGKPE